MPGPEQQQQQQQQQQGSPDRPGQFVPAQKALANAGDLEKFLQSETCRDYIAFVLALNQAVTSRKLSDASKNPSEPVQRMVGWQGNLSQGRMADSGEQTCRS